MYVRYQTICSVILDQHSIDGPVRIPLTANLRFSGRSVQMRIYDVQYESFSALYADDANGDKVGSGQVLERAVN